MPLEPLEDRIIRVLCSTGLVFTEVTATTLIAESITKPEAVPSFRDHVSLLVDHVTPETEHFIPATVEKLLIELNRRETMYGLIQARRDPMLPDGSFTGPIHRENMTREEAITWLREFEEDGGVAGTYSLVEAPVTAWRRSPVTEDELHPPKKVRKA